MELYLDPNPESQITLYRAVGLNEASDLETVRRFRLHRSPGFNAGKWFATTWEDTLRWGRMMQDFSHPRPFRVASVVLPAPMLATVDYFDRLDGIGPAYFVKTDRLTLLNQTATITVLPAVFEVEAGR